MTNTDQLFTAIAKRHLFIPTLKERKSDRLDFHEVSVLTVKDALQAAYDVGAKTASLQSATTSVTTDLYDTLRYVAEMLSGFKPDFLRNIGLDVALEKTSAALDAFEAITAQGAQS